MQVETVQGNDLVYLTLYPQGYDPSLSYPVIFMLHGFGANMYDLANLAGVIDTTGYVYVCPNAPIPVQLEPQMGWLRLDGARQQRPAAAVGLGEQAERHVQ